MINILITGKRKGMLSAILLLISFGGISGLISPTKRSSSAIVGSTSAIVCGQNEEIVRGSNRCRCKSGFTGDGISCTDINECSSSLTNFCDKNADCTNTIGSYTCACKAGFVGNGITCQDINECLITSTCDKNSECSNTPGSYKCKCNKGFTGNGFTCTDIDECKTGQSCSQICANTIGSFKCSCNTGYQLVGKSNCVDIDECKGSNLCDKNALCKNTPGDYVCTCNPSGFFGYVGNGFKCTEDRFVPYITAQSRTNIDEACILQRLENGIPIGDDIRVAVYVCPNGNIDIDTSRSNGFFSGQKLGRKRILAPFWSDLQLRSTGVSNGNRLYHGFYRDGDNQQSTISVLEKANKIASKYISVKGGASFKGTSALVATWIKVTPYPASKYPTQIASFQAVVLSNGMKSYLIYLYEDGGMLWGQEFFRVFVGYKVSQADERTIFNTAQSDSRKFDYDQITGNFGQKGVWVYPIGDYNPEPGRAPCSFWFARQNLRTATFLSLWRRADCPPSQRQANRDMRFIRIRNIGGYTCFQQRRPVYRLFTASLSLTQCCYNFGSRRLFTGIDRTAGPLSTIYYRPNTGFFTALFFGLSLILSEIATINKAFQDCCVDSTLCRPYVRAIPIPNGIFYRPPRRALAFGDPHVTTLDGKTYTYNGIGDYVMVKTLTSPYNFTCHARTEKAPVNVSAGVEASGSSFTGFAFSEANQPKVEFYLNLTDGTPSLKLEGNGENLSNFSTRQSRNGTSLLFANSTLEVSFPSGVVVTIVTTKGGLTPTFIVPEDFSGDTRGLLGNFNEDVSDDFIRPDGTRLDINSTEEQIFKEFGKPWQVTGTQSLFTNRGTNQSFIPKFFVSVDQLFESNLALKTQAIGACGGTSNRQCLYDAFATRDVSLAVQTMDTSKTFDNEQKILATFPPKISGPTLLNMTFGQSFTAKINASSNSSSAALKYFVEINGTTVNVDENTGEFVLNVTNYRNISLLFVVLDNQSGLSGVYRPAIKICYCLNGGVCNTSIDNELSLLGDSDPFLSNYACQCTALYSGPFCEVFRDPCEVTPCFPGVNCTVSIQTESRTCGACPQNYTGDGARCEAIDYCASKPCQQKCTNYLGRFECSCSNGYKLENTTQCADINECQSLPCHSNASCSNTPGSFNCTCNTGFAGNGTVCSDIDECSSIPCSHNCTNTVGSFACSCPQGFLFKTGSKLVCEDIDECKENKCSPNASCYNTPGSFLCLCKAGFSGDGFVCFDLQPSSSSYSSLTSSEFLHESTAVSYPGESSLSRPTVTMPTRSIESSTTIPASPSSFQPSFVISPVSLDSSQPPLTSLSLARSSFVASSVSHGIVSSSIVTGVCLNNPCKNKGICQSINGVSKCTCNGVFFGEFCTETRRIIEMDTTFTKITDGNTVVDLESSAFKSSIQNKSSATYARIKEALELALLEIGKGIDQQASVLITNMRIGSLIATYRLSLPNSNTDTISAASTKIKTELEKLGGNATSQQFVFTANTASVVGRDFDECKTDPCHSDAKCDNKDTSFGCTCNKGFKGDGFTCTSDASDTTTIIAIVGGTLGGLLLLIAVLLTFYAAKKRHHRRAVPLSRSSQLGSSLDISFMTSKMRASRLPNY